MSVVRLEDIVERIQSYHPDADVDLLRRAYIFSAKAHQGQVRLSGESYLIHPIEVAAILASLKLDVATVAAGLLHDTIEDTLATPEQIGATALFLCSDAAAQVRGIALPVDGGWTAQ